MGSALGGGVKLEIGQIGPRLFVSSARLKQIAVNRSNIPVTGDLSFLMTVSLDT